MRPSGVNTSARRVFDLESLDATAPSIVRPDAGAKPNPPAVERAPADRGWLASAMFGWPGRAIAGVMAGAAMLMTTGVPLDAIAAVHQDSGANIVRSLTSAEASWGSFPASSATGAAREKYVAL